MFYSSAAVKVSQSPGARLRLLTSGLRLLTSGPWLLTIGSRFLNLEPPTVTIWIPAIN